MVKKILAIVKPCENPSTASGFSILEETVAIIFLKTICNGQISVLSGMNNIALYHEFQLPTAKNNPIVANIGKDNGKKILTKMIKSFVECINRTWDNHDPNGVHHA